MKYSIIFLFFIFLCSCKSTLDNNQDEGIRNKIIFNDSLQKVENSIAKLNLYFDRIRKENNDTLWINYVFEEKKGVTFCENKVDTFTYQNINSIDCLINFTNEEKNDLIRTINLLKKNYITSMYCERGWNVYFYNYREIDKEPYNIREIYYSKEGVDTAVIKYLHVLYDTKSRLRLIGLKSK